MSWLCNGKLDCFIGINMDRFYPIKQTFLRVWRFFLEASLNKNNFFICANPIIHKKIIKILN